VLGPKFSRRKRAAMNLGSFYALCQVEYCRNFIFRKHFPIHKIFERSCELGLLSLTADKISEIFGLRVTKRLRGKLHTTLEHLERGRHVLRAYLKNPFLRQYEKRRTFLRNERCCNNLKDFSLAKSLDNLPAVRQTFQNVTDRFAAFQAQALNVHVDFSLFQRLALPVVRGRTKIPGIQLHHTRLIRLMELMIHCGASISTWRTNELHPRILANLCPLPTKLYPDPTALRPAQDESPWSHRTRWPTLCLPPHAQGDSRVAVVSFIPQTRLRPSGKQPLPPPRGSQSTTLEPLGNRVS
jgi:hypothetical protein